MPCSKAVWIWKLVLPNWPADMLVREGRISHRATWRGYHRLQSLMYRLSMLGTLADWKSSSVWLWRDMRSMKKASALIVALLVIVSISTNSELLYEQLLQNHPQLQFLVRHTYSKARRSPNTFPPCTMGACFNFSRCQGMKEPLIYHYSQPPFQPAKFFTGLQSSVWHTSDPHKACLFLLTEPEDFYFFKPHPNSLPFWNGGQNHVIVSFADKWVAPAPHTIGHASVLGSQLHQSSFRPGFDISLPLPGHWHFPNLQNLKPFDRKYFLTFKGTRYLGETEGSFRGNRSFRDMHNGKDVIVGLSCDHPSNNMIKKQNVKYAQECDEDNQIYQAYNFTDLMNSTFCLTPGGRSPSSYRFIEALSGGAIPVLICDDYVMPFETLIQWEDCMLQFPTSEMHRILPTLRALSKAEVERRQSHCLSIYNRHLKDNETLLSSTITSLKLRFHGVFPDFAANITS